LLSLAWISWLPLGLVHWVGGALGWLVYALSAPYRRRLRDNAARAGVGTALRRRSVSQTGCMAAEVPWLWLRDSTRPLAPLVTWDGDALVEQALARGRGLLFYTPHMGNFEITARGYAERYGSRQPITVLYRPARQPWLARLQTTAREHPGMKAAPATLAGVRQLIRALRNGEAVGLLPDQVPPEGQGVWAPFFGAPAYTMTLAARLVQQTEASVLFVWCERRPHGAGFVVHLREMRETMPPLGNDPTGALGAGVINRELEALIRQCPQQYLWGYNRHKQPRAAAREAGGDVV
jgi:Kdo2-lipid IVA lauroyltransferase/acyltransferase